MRAYKFHLPCLQFFRMKVVMKIDHDYSAHTRDQFNPSAFDPKGPYETESTY